EPGPDDPAGAVRVEPVVVVEVQTAQRLLLTARVEFDDADPAEVPADIFHVADQARRDVSVGRPHAALVRLAVVPEATAVECAGRRSERGEVGVATALPVHVLETFPFVSWDRWAVVVAQHDIARLLQDLELPMHASPRYLGPRPANVPAATGS